MHRVPATPRADWLERVSSQGLVYAMTTHPDGSQRPYWDESAYYSLTMREVEELEETTETLHTMCLSAARHLVDGEFGDLGLSPGALDVARWSLEVDPPSLLGRFDLRYDGTGPAKLLEYNADTPTGLVEAAVAQWYWLQDTHPELDQWNSLHERLVLAWWNLRDRLPKAPVWFAHDGTEDSGEELMTCTYLRDTCEQAGLEARSIAIADIGWNPRSRSFVGAGEEPLRTCFKLYPWETMLAEEFGRYVDPVPRGPRSTTWLEPPWKVVLSNKALLAALWALYPGHPNLLPAYLDGPRELTDWVAKPLHGREGAGLRVHAPSHGVRIETPHRPDGLSGVSPDGALARDSGTLGGGYGEEGWLYQEWCPLPSYEGNKVVIGSWVIDGKAAGAGIRESDGWITDRRARFVPHLIDSATPDAAQRQEWLADAATPLTQR